MGLPRKHLGRDEVVIRHMHSHVKELFLSGILAIVLVAAVVVAIIFMPESVQPWGTYAVIALAVVLAVWKVIVPWLRWLTDTYTITSRRIITRTGIIAKNGHDIPLARISNVAYEHDLIDRIFGCGTLILETSADNPLRLHDIPKVEEVHVELTELLFSSEGYRRDD
ncbi:PH domain-containing protein [Flaviflexus huanghaiensis]|uniref:PH domain-containing protein n=1 Tax=Flaviflexus huanghaiensis TaxID=1111473 RepID=UPI0015FAA8BF|nr:PH domain-containing protein [Flaviflexus huanghaiensis]